MGVAAVQAEPGNNPDRAWQGKVPEARLRQGSLKVPLSSNHHDLPCTFHSLVTMPGTPGINGFVRTLSSEDTNVNLSGTKSQPQQQSLHCKGELQPSSRPCPQSYADHTPSTGPTVAEKPPLPTVYPGREAGRSTGWLWGRMTLWDSKPEPAREVT